ncbi:agglutination protein [Chromobacterium phragmitis]|uniref:TolC family outer membrane protein n=1 Tax=Chromobacterium phragmitis TaxID=2202141 RepID=UPI000DEC785A|nr:TolC family outer membrane protein [Chromobacterium phragmitis]AXE29799.1 agglutination protein [Chromobacterium phragmitis]
MQRLQKRQIHLAVAALLSLSASLAQATSLREVVEKTVASNPDVRFRFHEFRSAAEETGIGRAGYMPTVDVSYTYARENNKEPLINNGPQIKEDFTRKGWSADLTQNLFQGFQTMNTVSQLEFSKRGKYYDFVDASEQQGLEAARAYLDVLRYRQLLDFAKESYGVHKGIYDQIEQKVKAGVGRRVDLEQAAGRLALSETNMINETSNLHDVSARYSRLIGEEPPTDMAPAPSLQDKLPRDQDLMRTAVRSSPAYLSSVANLRAAQSDLKVKKGAFSPTLDLRAHTEKTDNLDAIYGRHDKQMVQLVFNINLFRGGGDKARLGVSAERYNSALDLRDKTCRDLQQTVRIANNDVHKLNEQMGYLRQHALSTEKARDAYLKQFDIGQRTLLDVLDSENELYDSKRSLANAEYDGKLAQARVLAASGLLLPSLQLKPIEQQSFESDDAEQQEACSTAYTPPQPFNTAGIPVHPYVSSTMADAPPAPIKKSGKAVKH